MHGTLSLGLVGDLRRQLVVIVGGADDFVYWDNPQHLWTVLITQGCRNYTGIWVYLEPLFSWPLETREYSFEWTRICLKIYTNKLLTNFQIWVNLGQVSLVTKRVCWVGKKLGVLGVGGERERERTWKSFWWTWNLCVCGHNECTEIRRY